MRLGRVLGSDGSGSEGVLLLGSNGSGSEGGLRSSEDNSVGIIRLCDGPRRRRAERGGVAAVVTVSAEAIWPGGPSACTVVVGAAVRSWGWVCGEKAVSGMTGIEGMMDELGAPAAARRVLDGGFC